MSRSPVSERGLWDVPFQLATPTTKLAVIAAPRSALVLTKRSCALRAVSYQTAQPLFFGCLFPTAPTTLFCVTVLCECTKAETDEVNFAISSRNAMRSAPKSSVRSLTDPMPAMCVFHPCEGRTEELFQMLPRHNRQMPLHSDPVYC